MNLVTEYDIIEWHPKEKKSILEYEINIHIHLNMLRQVW